MKFVVVASIIIAVIANEPENDQLIEITKDADLLAPASVHWKIGNAFSSMIKRGRVSLEQDLEAIEIYRKIPIRHTEVELENSLAIVAKYGIYAYDAYLPRSAIKYNTALITLDRKLAQAGQEMNLK